MFRDAAAVVALSAVVALTTNAVRSQGSIPLVAEREYQVLVPCPEFQGDAEAVKPAEVPPDGQRQGVLVVDARGEEAYQKWHLPGAISIPFDYLMPTPPESVRRVLDSGAQRVIVYGDGKNPDTGEQLGRELAGKGIRNVSYVEGGAPALRRHRGENGQQQENPQQDSEGSGAGSPGDRRQP